MGDAFVTVFTSHDPIEAQMVSELLAENGLRPRLLGTQNAAMLGAAPFAFALRIEVPADEEERAAELVALVAGAEDAGGAARAAEAEALATPGPEGEGGPAALPEAAEIAALEPPPSTDPAWQPLLGLLAVHAVLFWASGETTERLRELGAISGWPRPGELYRLVTANFLHFDLRHLLSNTEGLVLFGWAAIRLFGLPRAALVYMVAAVASGLATALAFGPHSVAAGASGCVFALTAAVLAGKLRLALRAPYGRTRLVLRVAGWALFALPPALFFNYHAHLAGLVVGLVAGLFLPPFIPHPSAGEKRVRLAASLFASALFVLPWGMRVAAGFYSPCVTGNLDRCEAQCTAGAMRACYQLGLRTWKTASSNERARELLSRACASGEAEACSAYGTLLDRDATTRDGVAKDFLRKGCDGGSTLGCVNLAEVLWERYRSDEEAVKLYRTACEGGALPGCMGLARAQAAGRGMAQDVDAAIRLYRKTCDGGEPGGCAALAEIYLDGTLVRRDRDEAVGLYGQACRQGDRPSCQAFEAIRRDTAGPGWRAPMDPRVERGPLWDPLRFL
jgi:TPR repeat protein